MSTGGTYSTGDIVKIKDSEEFYEVIAVQFLPTNILILMLKQFNGEKTIRVSPSSVSYVGKKGKSITVSEEEIRAFNQKSVDKELEELKEHIEEGSNLPVLFSSASSEITEAINYLKRCERKGILPIMDPNIFLRWVAMIVSNKYIPYDYSIVAPEYEVNVHPSSVKNFKFTPLGLVAVLFAFHQGWNLQYLYERTYSSHSDRVSRQFTKNVDLSDEPTEERRQLTLSETLLLTPLVADWARISMEDQIELSIIWKLVGNTTRLFPEKRWGKFYQEMMTMLDKKLSSFELTT